MKKLSRSKIVVNFLAGCLISTSLFFTGCGGLQKKKAQPANPDLVQQLTKIKARLKSNKKDGAIQSLQKFVKDYPNTEISDEAYILLGDEHYARRDFVRAHEIYIELANSDTSTPHEAEARIKAARALIQLNKPEDALVTIDPIFKMQILDQEQVLAGHKIRYMIALQKSDRMGALRTSLTLAQSAPTQSDRDAFRLRAHDIVESKLTPEELNKVSTSSEFDFVRGPALFRLGATEFESGHHDRARALLSSAIEKMPDSQTGDRAKEMIEQIDSRSRVNPRVVGAILPLSGKQARAGYKTLRGIQLGLGIYGSQPSNIRLAVIDSETNPDLARRAVKRLVMEDNAVAIIGSLQGKTAMPVASKSQEFGVPNITLSQKAGITQAGSFIFQDALSTEMQVRELVDVAMTKKKLTKFAILYPNDSYGVEFANLFWDEVLARGGKITAVQTYDPEQKDFNVTVRRLVGTYTTDDRTQEYQSRLKAWTEKQKNQTGREDVPDLLPPIVDFEAIFIPDGPTAVGQIAPTLLSNDIEKVTLLGTQLWNNTDLISRAGKYVENSIFIDNAPGDKVQIENTEFGKNFQKTFDYKPETWEVHGYDSAALIRHLVEKGVSTRAELQNQLSRIENFPGSIGNVSVSSRREIQRPVLALTVKDGVIQPLN